MSLLSFHIPKHNSPMFPHNNSINSSYTSTDSHFSSIKPSSDKNIYNIHIVDKMKIVLDLDETLVHSDFYHHDFFKLNKMYDNINSILTNYDNKILIINIRPYLYYFLSCLFKYFDLYLFTKGKKKYADIVIDRLEIRKFFKHIYTYEDCKIIEKSIKKSSRVCCLDSLFLNAKKNCLITKNSIEKDISIIDHDFSRIIVIDDNKVTSHFQYIIKPYLLISKHKDHNLLKSLYSIFQTLKYRNIKQYYFYKLLNYLHKKKLRKSPKSSINDSSIVNLNEYNHIYDSPSFKLNSILNLLSCNDHLWS